MSSFNYRGNRKPYAAVLCHSADADSLKAVFDALEAKGLMLYVVDEKRRAGSILKKACGVISVFSESFNESEALQSLFLSADSAGKTIVPLRADDSTLPELFTRLAYTNNSINLLKYSPEEAAARILTAPCFAPPKVTPEQIRAYKRTAAALIAAAVAVAAIVAVPLLKAFIDKKEAVPEIDPFVADMFGLTEDELAEIRYVIIDGDKRETEFDEDQGLWSVLYESWDDDRRTWRRIEDGKEVEKGTTQDFSFLTMLPNLRNLVLINQSAAELPDLSGLERLACVELLDCDFENIEGLRNCEALNFVTLSLDALTDLSPLNDCRNLTGINISGCRGIRSLEGFDPPALRSLDLYLDDLNDISQLSGFGSLSHLSLSARSIKDFSPIGGCTWLTELYLNIYGSGIDFSFLSGLPYLRTLECRCREAGNFDSFRAAAHLTSFRLEFYDQERPVDLSFLSGCKLYYLDLYNVSGDFILPEGITRLYRLTVHGRISRWEGLEGLTRIDELDVNMRSRSPDTLLDVLNENGVYVDTLRLEDCGTPDLAKLPPDLMHLTLNYCDTNSLEGMSCTELRSLELQQLNRLSSLNGMDTLEKLTRLDISSCVRLTDWSMLYGREIKELAIYSQFSLPDFSQLTFSHFGKLRLDRIPGLTELSCLDALNEEYAGSSTFILELAGDELFNLKALERFSASKLTVPPSLEGQAAELVEKGCFRVYNIEYSDDGWNSNFDNFTLESLDELYTLPDALLARLTRLSIGGNEVYNNGWFGWNGDSGENCRYTFQSNEEGAEEIELTEKGSITDFSVLSKLTGLEELTLANQPLGSVEGIQNLSSLKRLELIGCDTADISPLFALSSLRELRLEDCRNVTSIAGIQNLSHLHDLNTKGSHITDYSPLGRLTPSAYSDSGFRLSIMAYDENCMPGDFSFLTAIKSFDYLELHGCPAEDWSNFVSGADIREVCLFNCFYAQEEFERFIGSTHGLLRLYIPWNETITDLGCIIGLDGLEYVRISSNMEDALGSLKGREYGFELEIES